MIVKRTYVSPQDQKPQPFFYFGANSTMYPQHSGHFRVSNREASFSASGLALPAPKTLVLSPAVPTLRGPCRCCHASTAGAAALTAIAAPRYDYHGPTQGGLDRREVAVSAQKARGGGGGWEGPMETQKKKGFLTNPPENVDPWQALPDHCCPTDASRFKSCEGHLVPSVTDWDLHHWKRVTPRVTFRRVVVSLRGPGRMDGPPHVASGRCVLSAAAAGAPAGVVSAFAEPSSWCAGAVLDVAGWAVCASAAPNNWRIEDVLVVAGVI